MTSNDNEFDTSRYTLLVLDDDKAGAEAMAHLLAAVVVMVENDV